MVNLFDNITEKKQDKILKFLSAHMLNFPENYDVFPMINSNDIVCYVKSGCVSIIREDYYGNRIILEEVHDGETFISNVSYGLSDDYKIITREATTIFVINYSNIIDYDYMKYEYFVNFISNLFSIIKDETKLKNDRIEILTKRSIRDKLLEYFRIESKKHGNRTFRLPFTFTELADYLAIDRSAMTREIKNLKDEGFITVENKIITLIY